MTYDIDRALSKVDWLDLRVELIINDIGFRLQKSKNQKAVDKDVRIYKELREVMIKVGFPEKEFSERYDKRLTNFLRRGGYQIPKLN